MTGEDNNKRGHTRQIPSKKSSTGPPRAAEGAREGRWGVI
eukprot:CAMPEP_0180128250 /NCGR_PEP_ID=MMETSP0986-20121125/6654_1 /TAXON_ID=697907 /ORGANISM="non described non described, Strain CCMP2293" /LENGTH=39 /DNA_ID= /DNA_START= /DNA_END= /DNA_ORIENTATION=